MSTGTFSGSNGADDAQTIWVGHEAMCSAIQCRLLPHISRDVIRELLHTALVRGLEGAIEHNGAQLFAPQHVLDQRPAK